jgi:hypothetical protein
MERTALWLVAEALFATEAGPPAADRIQWTLRDHADFMHRSGGQIRWLFGAALAALVWASPVFLLRPPLTWQPLAKRIDSLNKLEQTPLRLALLLVKASLCVIYYEHPDAEREIGYDGKCMRA